MVVRNCSRWLRAPLNLARELAQPDGLSARQACRPGRRNVNRAAGLEDGINEQIFTDEEYTRVFDAAGLVATRAVIDGGSFKPSYPAMA
jgi:hypothetical protein